jgi:hydrophobic/amphiphilic exporter-1 (mainly G- bacteria), HAE1 family
MNLPRFGVERPVPVNLLMIAILVLGAAAGWTLRREFFPEITPNRAIIELPYPGATPREVEQGLAIKVEDKLAELDDVRRITTTLSENGGGVVVEFREGADVDKAMTDVERAIDGLTDLPEESERVQVRLLEPRIPVVRVTLHGDVDEAVLKRAIRDIRDDLRLLPNMGEILVDGVRPYEIRVDVDQHALLRLGISLVQVSDAIGLWMTEFPGGTVRSPAGHVRIRTMGVPEEELAIREIVVAAGPDGEAVRVEDIAQVREGFVDEQVITRYNGQPAASLTVFRVGNQDIVEMAQSVRAYVQGRRGDPITASWLEKRWGSSRFEAWERGAQPLRPLPPGTQIDYGSDFARFVEERLDLLLRNARAGAILVFLTLLLVLNWRPAMWVSVGLATALLGTLVAMSLLDITLNLLTIFGLIVVLGLLVDDAIVVAENIQSRHDGGEPALRAAEQGAREVQWPVVATVLTSVVAFLPLTFIRGQMGDLLGALPLVVACALAMSLLESLLILPSHVGHSLHARDHRVPHPWGMRLRQFEDRRDRFITEQMIPGYQRSLERMLERRYFVLASAVSAMLVSAAIVTSGRLEFVFLSRTDAETIIVDVRMPIGTGVERTAEIVERIERAARSQEEVTSVSTTIGQRSNVETGMADAFAPHIAQLYIELTRVEFRQRESHRVIDSIRQALYGQLDEIDRLTFQEIAGGPGGPDITLRVRGESLEEIEEATFQLREQLSQFAGVYDIVDDNDVGQLELQVSLKPDAAALNLTTGEVARQVRGFLYGLEAHVFADREEDIKVRVRLDESTRRSIHAMENSWIVAANGLLVPLSEVAVIEERSTNATIKRVDRQRAITVTAETAPWLSPEAVVTRLNTARSETHYWLGVIPHEQRVGPSLVDEVRRAFPTLSIEFTGRQEQQRDAFESLPYGFLAAVVMIYVILAWLFSNYLQPLIVLTVVPFSLVGVIWGHVVLGYELTFLSLIGFVALSGIVVNDSLILVKFYNARRREGETVGAALINAGGARVRAILLTTVTTVLGLTPLILEQSFQARFLIPMAISIAAGLISTTFLVLVVLPCLVLAFNDLRAAAYFLWHGRPRTRTTPSRLVHQPLEKESHESPS